MNTFGSAVRLAAPSTAGGWFWHAILAAQLMGPMGLLQPRLGAVQTPEQNPVDFFVNLGISAACLIATVLRPHPHFRALAAATWPLFLVAAFALASAVWSPFPDVTARRGLRLGLALFVSLVAVSRICDQRQVLGVAFGVCLASLAMNGLALALGVAGPPGLLHGIFSHKNSLGAVAALSVLLTLSAAFAFRSSRLRFIALLAAASWAALLVLSGSKTSTTVCAALVLCWFVLGIVDRSTSPSLLRVFGQWFGVLALAFGLVQATALTPLLTALGQSDLTFTGRTHIWRLMEHLFRENWIIGTGYGALWNTGDRGFIEMNSNNFILTLRQAHNGYLETLTSIGVLGYALFGVAWVMLWRRMGPSPTQTCAGLMLAFATIHNFQETSFLSPGSLTWLLPLIMAFAATQVGTYPPPAHRRSAPAVSPSKLPLSGVLACEAGRRRMRLQRR